MRFYLKAISCVFVWLMGLSIHHALAQNQGLAHFTDNQNLFRIFANGNTYKAEFLPVTIPQVNDSVVVYLNYRGKIKRFHPNDTIRHLGMLSAPILKLTNGMLFYNFNGLIASYNGKKMATLANFTTSKVYHGDRYLAYVNNTNEFMIFDGKEHQMAEDIPPVDIKTGNRTMAYTNQFDEFKIWYNSQLVAAEFIPVLQYQVGADVVAYLNDALEFKIYDKGVRQDFYLLQPRSFKVGDGIVAFVDDQDIFRVYYKGELIDLLYSPPKQWWVKDELLVYTDNAGFTYTFYRGKNERLENYTIQTPKFARNTVVYKDLNDGLKQFYWGQQAQITKSQTIDFTVFPHTVLYQTIPQEFIIYWDGKTYRYQ